MIVIYNHRWQTHLLRFPISNCCCFTHRIHHVDPPHPPWNSLPEIGTVVGRSPISTEFHEFQPTSSSPLITPLKFNIFPSSWRFGSDHHLPLRQKMLIFRWNQPLKSSRGVNNKRLPSWSSTALPAGGDFFFPKGYGQSLVVVAVSSGVKPFRLANVRGLGPHVLVVTP